MDASLKKIRIQTGVVQRIKKEKFMYEKETEDIKVEIEKMKEKGLDEYDIKKKNELLQESQMMVPDCEKRLSNSVELLKNLLEVNQQLSESEIFQKAQTVLSEVKN